MKKDESWSAHRIGDKWRVTCIGLNVVGYLPDAKGTLSAETAKYCNRPFSSVDEMNEVMFERWNRVVSPEDRIIHGGDFALGKFEMGQDLLSLLNGYKVLILGNHDGHSANKMKRMGFDEVYKKSFYENGILVCHTFQHGTSLKSYPHCNHFFYGHIHSNHADFLPGSNKDVNICVEVQDYTPKTLEELIA